VQRLENQYPEEKAVVSWVRRRNYAHFTRAGVLLKVNSKFRIFQEAETCGLVPRDHTCYVQRLENQYPEEKAAVSWVRRRNYAHFTRAGVLLKVNSKFRIFQEAETCGLVPRDQNLVVTGECTVNLRDESTLIPNCARSYKKRMKY